MRNSAEIYINSRALPLVSSEKEYVSETRCQRHNCSLENKHIVGSSALLVCHAHTHTHTRILLMTNLVQICPRLDTEKELFSARKHSKYTKILSFKSAFEHFKYRVVQLRPHT